MTTLKPIACFSVLGSAVVVGLCLMQQAQAASGACEPVSGSAQQYQFVFTAKLEKPTDNIIGGEIPNANEQSGVWSGQGGSYLMNCDCPSPPRMAESYIFAVPSPELAARPIGEINGIPGYQLNDYLGVSAEVYMGGEFRDYTPVPTPVGGLSNRQLASSGQRCTNAVYASGSRGKIHLKILQPFTGEKEIVNTKLLGVSISAASGVASPPASEVWMSGKVVVPQSCSFDPSPITIEFGKDIDSNNFKTKGAGPNGLQAIKREITLNCLNISGGVKVNLSFTGTPDKNDPGLLEARNKDGEPGFGMRITDGNGEPISPNGGQIPSNINNKDNVMNSQGIATISVLPINTTGKPALVGPFEATATIDAVIP